MTDQSVNVIDNHLETLNKAIARANATLDRGEAVLDRESFEDGMGPVATAILHFVIVSAILFMCWASYDIAHNVLRLMRAP